MQEVKSQGDENMIISKLLNSIKSKSQREDIVLGLAWGLAWGIAGGVVWGLASGLAWGLASGLAGGLAWGLASGLAGGLVNYTDLQITMPLWILLGIIFIASNIINFCLNDNKRISRTRFFFEKELLGFVEVLTIVINFFVWKRVLSEIDLIKYSPIIIQWFGYIGIAIVCIGLIWLVFEIKYKLYTKNSKEGRKR